ncbi:MAG: P-II family nitrogen regulator [Methylophilaceae bacterium]|nr:P-II family nitrogen regulator [Methylophilaceae bacterium]
MADEKSRSPAIHREPSLTREANLLDEASSLSLLAKYRVPVVTHALCQTEEEAVVAFVQMKVTSVVVKGCTDAVSHKSELGLVKLGIRDELSDYTPKVRLDMVVPDHLVEGVLQIIVEVAHTGQIGDGIVWVTPVERMIRLSEEIVVHDC